MRAGGRRGPPAGVMRSETLPKLPGSELTRHRRTGGTGAQRQD